MTQILEHEEEELSNEDEENNVKTTDRDTTMLVQESIVKLATKYNSRVNHNSEISDEVKERKITSTFE